MNPTLRAFALAAGMALSAGPAGAAETETAIFAGGCFWCVESDFDHVEGVTETTSGYIGGSRPNPTYQDYGASGHIEAVEIKYDPDVVSYEQLLKTFFRTVDPTDGGGQFCDRGPEYATAIFTLDEEQKRLAEAAKAEAAAALDAKIATDIRPATEFWPAEDYHQNYYNKNSLRYRYYRYSCGRDARIEELWGDQAHFGVGS